MSVKLTSTRQAAKLGGLKITVTGRLNRTLDQKSVKALDGQVPAELLEKVFPVKHELSVAGLRAVESTPYWNDISRAITTKPGKPGVEIERIEK